MLHDLAPVILPGTNMNTSWLLAMETLYRRLGSPPDMAPNYARYRRLQAMHCEQEYHVHRASLMRTWSRRRPACHSPSVGA